MERSTDRPPQLPLKFFRWFCRPDYAEDIEGDLTERYEYRLQNEGKWPAKWHFYKDVLALFRPSMIQIIKGTLKYNYYAMFKHDILIGWRSLLKNASYSILNIGGLAIGLAVATIIGLWIHDELTYNTNHENYHSIGKVVRHEIRDGEILTNSIQTTGVGTALATEYKNHFKHVALYRWKPEERVIGYNDISFTEDGYFMQPDGPKLLTLKMQAGSRDGLKDMHSILLSKSLAQKLFGDKNPINELVSFDARENLKVTGVYEDIPHNSEFSQASYFAPLDLYLNGWSNLNVWNNYNMQVLVELNEGRNFTSVSNSITDAMLPHLSERSLQREPRLFLSPMEDWRLYGTYEQGIEVANERLKVVWFYGIIGVFILILACINFMNLSTARAGNRLKEIGVRKTLGALRRRLMTQFLCEAMLVSLFSLGIALAMVFLSLTWFNQISGKELVMLWDNQFFWMAIIGFTLFTALLSGSYPAFYLSSFDPVKSLKGTLATGKYSAVSRKVLVVFQFTISITLIIGTLVVNDQIEYAMRRPMGYETDRLISLRPGSPDYWGKYSILRNRLLETGVVEEMAESNYEVTSTLGWNDDFSWPGKPPGYEAAFNTVLVTPEYGKTVGLQFAAGRDFSREFASDKNAIVINESAVDLFAGLEKPLVGKTIKFNHDYYGGPNFTIIGVTKDMIKGSPFEETDPFILFPSKSDQRWLYIRIKVNVALSDAIDKIEKAFLDVVPSTPFDFKFADQAYNAKFNEEKQVFSLAKVFSGLAIFISCLGLFGLVSYVAEQRTKEIGIRKVLGATFPQLWRLLSKEFIFLVFISIVIAMPIASYFMQRWLEQYKYRTEIQPEILMIGGLVALIVTISTISFRTFKVATANPVKSLKDE